MVREFNTPASNRQSNLHSPKEACSQLSPRRLTEGPVFIAVTALCSCSSIALVDPDRKISTLVELRRAVRELNTPLAYEGWGLLSDQISLAKSRIKPGRKPTHPLDSLLQHPRAPYLLCQLSSRGS